jgi:hypothetical protein
MGDSMNRPVKNMSKILRGFVEIFQRQEFLTDINPGMAQKSFLSGLLQIFDKVLTRIECLL